MKISPFKLERYFAQYEFKVKYLLSPSDVESLAMYELVEMASPESRGLWDNLRLSYTESPGHPSLREEIANLYETLSAKELLVAAPEEIIYLVMNALLQQGDEVIVLAPAYQSLYQVADSLGCKVLPWWVKPTSSGWQLDLDWLADHLTKRARLLVVNFPHNPSGYLPGEDELQAILNLASHFGTNVFCDEMYRGLEYRPTDKIPSVADRYERASVLSGLSKTYALPGLRIGWLGTHNSELLENVQNLKDYTTICNSAPSEILGIIALQNKANIIRRSLEIIQHNIQAAETFFNRFPDQFEWLPPCAGSIAFPEFIGAENVEHFCQTALDQVGVMVVPGSMFDYPGNHFRVGLGRRNFTQALNELEKLFHK